MDIFRRKQKLVFWIVAIFVIPSFALVWGVGGPPTSGGGSYTDPLVASIDGHELTYTQAQAFGNRLTAGAGLPVRYLTGFNYYQQPEFLEDDLMNSVVFFAHLQLAQQYGVTVHDDEVRRFIRNEHALLSPAFRDQWDNTAARHRVLNQLASRYNLSSDQLLQGVREWLTLRRFYALDRALSTPSPDGTYLAYAQSRAQYVVKRLRFPASAELRDRALVEFNDLPEDRQLDELERTLARLAQNPAYREPARFRLEYLLVPFEKAPAVEPTENQLLALYNQRTDLKNSKTFTEVREQLLIETMEANRRDWARRQINEEVDREILRRAGDPAATVAAPMAALADYLDSQNLVRVGVIGGHVGETALTAAQVAALPTFAITEGDLKTDNNVTVGTFLQNLNDVPDDQLESARALVLNRFFDNPVPFETSTGLVRVRIVEWIPARPMSLTREDGAIDADVRAKAFSAWIDNRAEDFAREQATAAVERFRADDASDFEGLAPETLPAWRAQGDLTGRAVDSVGDPQRFAAVPAADDHPDHEGHADHAEGRPAGYEVVLLAERRLPSREDFAALAPLERSRIESIGVDAQPSRVGVLDVGGGEGYGNYVIAVAPGSWLQTWLAELAAANRFRFIPIPQENR